MTSLADCCLACLVVGIPVAALCVVAGLFLLWREYHARSLRLVVSTTIAACTGWIVTWGISSEVDFIRHATRVVARVVESPGVKYQTRVTGIRNSQRTTVATYPHLLEFDRRQETVDLGASYAVGTRFIGFYNARTGSGLRLQNSEPAWTDLLEEHGLIITLFLIAFVTSTYIAIRTAVQMIASMRNTGPAGERHEANDAGQC